MKSVSLSGPDCLERPKSSSLMPDLVARIYGGLEVAMRDAVVMHRVSASQLCAAYFRARIERQ